MPQKQSTKKTRLLPETNREFCQVWFHIHAECVKVVVSVSVHNFFRFVFCLLKFSHRFIGALITFNVRVLYIWRNTDKYLPLSSRILATRCLQLITVSPLFRTFFKHISNKTVKILNTANKSRLKKRYTYITVPAVVQNLFVWYEQIR